MSRAIALVKFDDGEILNACYMGTSDNLCPWMIRDKDLDERFHGSVFDWNDHCWDSDEYDYLDEDTKRLINDNEHCEIYIDYGNGFMWMNQTASRSRMYITSSLDYDDHSWNEEIERDDIAQWVIDYHIQNGMSIDMFKGRIIKKEVKVEFISEERISDEEYERSRQNRVDENGWTERQKEILNTYMSMMGLKITF